MPKLISEEEALDLLYEPIANQAISEHRWHTTRLIIFQHKDGELRGFYYYDPATEMQEGGDVFESIPVPTYPVTSREVTVTVYDVKKK